MERACRALARPAGSTKPDDGEATVAVWPSRVVRAGLAGWRRLAAVVPTSPGVARRCEDALRDALGRTWVPASPCGVSTPCGPGAPRPSARPKPRGDPPCAFAPLQRHPAKPRKVPRARGRACRTLLPLLGSCGPTTHSRCADLHGRGSRHDPRPRAGFGYPLRGTGRRACRRAKRRSVLGLHPPGLVPRGGASPSRGRCPPGVAGPRAAR